MKTSPLTTTRRRAPSQQSHLIPAPRSPRPLVFLGLALLALVLAVVALMLLPFSDTDQTARNLVALAANPTRPPSGSPAPAEISPTALPQPSPTPTATPVVTPTIGHTPSPEGPCPPPPGWVPYVVRAGDTLNALAQRHNIAVQAIIEANCLTSFMVYAGQTIYLPNVSTPTVPPTTVVSPTQTPTPTFTPQPPPLPAGAAAKFHLPPEVINVILLGSDSRVQGKVGRTDTMILVSVNPVSKTVGILSIPRDLWVYIPTHGYDRINTANVWGTLRKYPGGGPALVKATIEYNFGIPVHYYAAVDLKGFIKLIDTLGGVTIAVECPFPDLELEPGIRHMNGQWALAYARSRITSSDFSRSRRQQQVLLALWDQVLRPETISQIPALWATFQNSVATDMSLDQIIALAHLGTQINTRQISSWYIDYHHVKAWVTPQGAQVLLPQHDKIRPVLVELFAPPEEWDLILAKVEIRNAGCTRFQAKELAAVRLYYLGFDNVQIGPDQPEVRPRTIIVDYTSDAEAIALLRQAFNVLPEDVWFQEQDNPPLDALVLLGRNFNPCRR